MRWLLLVLLAGCGYVADVAPDQQPGARLVGDDVLVKWTAEPFPWQARIPEVGARLVAEPGGTWTLPYEVTVDLSRHRDAVHRPFEEIVVAVLGEWRHDEDGSYRPGAITHALSSNFTTTGIGIERWDGWPRLKAVHGKEGSPFEGVAKHALPQPAQGKHTFSGTITVNIEGDAPVGWYEPRVHVFAKVQDVEHPLHLSEYSYEWNDFVPGNLPLVRVGDPKPRRIPWSILAEYPSGGRVGTLPRQASQKLKQLGRSGFNPYLILRPGTYQVQPSFPSIFPRDSMPQIDGGDDVLTERFDHYLVPGNGEVTARLSGPGGRSELGSRRFARPSEGPEEAYPRPRLEGGGFEVDLSETGHYQIELNGWMDEQFGRRVTGGGTYDVTIAHHLSFSSSCKPGTSFLVGDGYSAKINVNPPFAAEVEVVVDFYPNSDPSRMRSWTGSGKANAIGHFVPYGTPPIVFDEPGEYISYVTVQHTDPRGDLWFGHQVSSGVIAPRVQQDLDLHGAPSFPWLAWSADGAQERFADRHQVHRSWLPQTNLIVQDPFVPVNPEDTLFMPVNYSEENTIQPKFAYGVTDPELAKTLSDAYSRASALPIRWNQPPWDHINYLEDVVELAPEAFAIFPTGDKPTEHLPIGSIGRDGWHPFGFPQKKRWEAYVYTGVIRPGFPVLTSVHEVGGKGFYWTATPNVFGEQFNRGLNGDSPEDVYRVAAGMVLKDLETGVNRYDAYASTIVFRNFEEAPGGASILAPGERVIRRANEVDHHVFLASDTHDVLSVGEMMGVGGVVMPVVPAVVDWTVTKPSGKVEHVRGVANRLGVVRGSPLLPVDEPGVWHIEPKVEWEGHTGTLPGTVGRGFDHFVIPEDHEPLIRSSIPGRSTINAVDGVEMELSWPKELRNAKLHFGVIMPGAVMDQGVIETDAGEWTYDFEPVQWVAQTANFDGRNWGTGDWELAETMVFQFFLEAENAEGEKVFDGLRLFLRRDQLYNYRAIMGR